MHYDYTDITDRITEEPKWWDECAVPRYCAFDPEKISNIYARECALVEISCQNCGAIFQVAMSNSYIRGTVKEAIQDKSLHYGDPPNTGCCAAGPTMNCNDLRVLEYWYSKGSEWQRDRNLEISLQAGGNK